MALSKPSQTEAEVILLQTLEAIAQDARWNAGSAQATEDSTGQERWLAVQAKAEGALIRAREAITARPKTST